MGSLPIRIRSEVPTPVKTALGSIWRDLEHEVEIVVRQALGIAQASVDWEELVKHADLMALATERRDLMHFDAERNLPWRTLGGVEPFHEKIGALGWSHQWWADVFLDRYNELRRAWPTINLPQAA